MNDYRIGLNQNHRFQDLSLWKNDCRFKAIKYITGNRVKIRGVLDIVGRVNDKPADHYSASKKHML